MDNDQIGRLLVFASQIIVCPLAFIATGLILGTRMIWFFWLMLCICTALSCLIADKVYTSRTSPFAWLETFWHNFIHGIAVLFDRGCQTALQQTYADLEQELAKLGEQRYSDDFHHFQEIDKIGRFYPPYEPLPRYELTIDDDWQSRDTSDMPVTVNEKAVTSFK